MRPPRRRQFLAAALFLYAGSYAALSRRGAAEAADAGTPYFFYAPLRFIGPDSAGLAAHDWLRLFYAPVNEIDRRWFGGPEACGGVTWGFR